MLKNNTLKNIIIITLLIIASNLQIYAQKEPYIPILTDSLHWWQTFYSEVGVGCYEHSINETQLYNDTIYYSNGSAWYVEDTTTRKIYSVFFGSDSVYRDLMYDFSLNEGDSVWLPNYVNAYFWFYVDSVRYINTYAGNRKTWYLHFNDGEYREYPIWVEGIGSLAGFYQFNTEPGMWYQGQGLLTCFYQGDFMIFEHELAKQYDCALTGYLDFIETNNKNDIIAYPNPVFNKLYINSENIDLTNSFFEIFNLYGKLLKHERLNNKYYIDLKECPSGTYFIKISSKTHSFIQKIIKN